ncbi:MAG: protein-L-isoaspartate O-methyltransferase [Thermoplasmata archaeon]|nr:protein-L-isoaspartate O-methyltransferase [Thermoplasmata archaeon]
MIGPWDTEQTVRDREQMVRALGTLDPRIAGAMRRMPRHRFVPASESAHAYFDEPVPLGPSGSTVSAPHMVALQLAALDLRAGVSLLEVGSGSGYLLALAAEIIGPSGRLVGLEHEASLVERSRRVLADLGFGARVKVEEADGWLGWPSGAPYDRIVVSAATARLQPQWRAQLREGGRLVLPLGPPGVQRLLTVRAGPEGDRYESGPACQFVPLTVAGSPHI